MFLGPEWGRRRPRFDGLCLYSKVLTSACWVDQTPSHFPSLARCAGHHPVISRTPSGQITFNIQKIPKAINEWKGTIHTTQGGMNDSGVNWRTSACIGHRKSVSTTSVARYRRQIPRTARRDFTRTGFISLTRPGPVIRVGRCQCSDSFTTSIQCTLHITVL